MNYQNFYDRLIARGINRGPIDEYTEKHHIIPQCMNGPDDVSNLVRLTAREHFLAHAALAKVYDHTPDGYKLSSAFNKMCQDGQGGKRYFNSRMFEIARKLFSQNHPCKQEHIKDKIRAGMIRAGKMAPRVYRDMTCQCGCNTIFSSAISTRKYAPNHTPTRHETRICACGCDNTFKTLIKSKKKYINGHNHTHQDYLDRMGSGVSKSLSTYLENLTTEELSDRMKKSWGSCDHVARGNSISAGKKGKKTNQQQIMGERYAAMPDEEFLKFLETKSSNMHNRIKKLRNKWIKS